MAGEKLIAENRKARHDYHLVERHEAGLALTGTEVKSVRERGFTLVPTRLYWKNGRAKVEIALGRGKEARDKRRDIAQRDAQREMERALKARR